jgi:uncharacterized protein with FMN-binding domain
MKYVLFFVLFAAVIVSGCAVFKGGKASKPVQHEEIYEGNAMGYRGPIFVQVRLSAGSIIEINIVDSAEDRFVGGAAMEELADMVIEYNSTDVDVISGATVTSKGFLDAVNNAIMGYE